MAGLINPFGAARSGDLTLLRLYFDRGGDPNQADSDSFTALHFACNGGHRDVVAQLIQHRAEVNARSHFQSTPLHFACEHGFVEIVRLLLANGATVDACNSDQGTPLHFASQKGHVDAVQLLVGAGAKVDARSNRGNSPLHYACFFGRYPVVRLLLMNGADIGLRNDGGARPGEQFFGKVPRETRASLSTLLRERSLSPGSRTPVGAESFDCADDPTTVTALNSLVRHLRAESAGLRESLRERDAEIEQLKKKMALLGLGTRETGTD